MGKAVLILALGISAIIGVLIINLNANATGGVETTVDMFKSTKARLIANSGIEVYLEKLRRNKTLSGKFPGNSLFDGSFDIAISGPDSQMVIQSQGNYFGTKHKSIVTARRAGVIIPPVNSALYLSAQNLKVKLQGNIEIDGNDTNMDGTPGPKPPLPGIAVDTPGDSAYVVNEIKPKVSKDIKGYGGPPSVHTVNDTTDWQSLTEHYIFAADLSLTTGTYSTGTFGTISEPKITYVTGNVHFSGNASGSGIMVVNGNLTMSGNFRFNGILIAYGNSTIDVKVVGNGGIYGATILVGQSVDIQSTGNASFFYSSQAIKNAQTNLKSSRFEILSWWE